MNGQWIGKCEGTNTGLVFLNVDEMPAHFQGVGHLLDDNKLVPGAAIFFATKDKNRNFEFRSISVYPIDSQTAVPTSWDKIKHRYTADVRMPNYVDVKGKWEDEFIEFSWTTDVGTSGKCRLPKSEAGKPSVLIPVPQDWEGYKKYVATLEGRKRLFRGQNTTARLRTSFHRTGRADLHRYVNDDIQVLYRQLSGRTNHIFDLDDPNENGAFYNLLQHHGYPTPLLDWTYSPYVAVFFAYRGITNKNADKADPDKKVRVHVFDQAQWKNDWKQLHALLATAPHFSIEEFMSIENPRMIPQQSASTLTNLDDIETYIKAKEANGKFYIAAIDLPVRERRKVMNELTYMGITAGSLFPGLDGACEELKERNFDI
ncbi:MAG TPA: FRG domain-containing protein [Candidatus Acidoferrum sp.]|nr:FRG domain-containing protein [Candidatus Acidoferrum sp.]